MLIAPGALESCGLGAVVTELTVTRKLMLVVNCPSLALTVILAVPLYPAAGVTVTVRFEPDPPNAIFSVGTKVGFDDPPLSVKRSAKVRGSPTVNPIAGAEVP